MIDDIESNEDNENVIETEKNVIENNDDITENKTEDDKTIETAEETQDESDVSKRKKKEKHAKEGISNFATIIVASVCLIISITAIILCYLVLTDKIKI